MDELMKVPYMSEKCLLMQLSLLKFISSVCSFLSGILIDVVKLFTSPFEIEIAIEKLINSYKFLVGKPKETTCKTQA
jgi:hypothetical protein